MFRITRTRRQIHECQSNGLNILGERLAGGISANREVSHIAEFCEWLPFTGIVVKQKNFHVENLDADPTDPKSVKGVLHNSHSFEMLGSSSITLFNIALPEKGSKFDKPLVLRKDKQGSIVRLQCDQHEFMQSFFLPVTNLYYAVVKDDGTFEIEDVPAGKHKLLAWHPFAGRVEISRCP